MGENQNGKNLKIIGKYVEHPKETSFIYLHDTKLNQYFTI